MSESGANNNDLSSPKEDGKVVGIVTESLPNTHFRVEIEPGQIVMAYLSGKMRLHRIRVLVGDKVEILLDPYGGKGRITKRL